MSFYHCPKCGGIPGVTGCCTDKSQIPTKPITEIRKEASMERNWVLAQWCLSIWNPDLMNFLQGTRRRQKRLFYKAIGIVVHDRALNGRPTWH